MVWGDQIYVGKFFEIDEKESLSELEPVLRDGPVSKREGGITQEQAERIIQRMM